MAQSSTVLHVLDVLTKYTDVFHGLTMEEICEKLEERNIVVERRSVSRAFKDLREYGYIIERSPNHKYHGFALKNPTFNDEELTVMVDAVQSSPFLTEEMCVNLIEKLKKMATAKHENYLEKRVNIPAIVRIGNENVFKHLDLIQDALNNEVKVSFRYFTYSYDKSKDLHNEGKSYVVTPIRLVYCMDYYYLVGYVDGQNRIKSYRLDRMETLLLTMEPAVRNETTANYRPEDRECPMFNFFTGAKKTVTLLVTSPSAITAVFDKFGRDIDLYPLPDGDEGVKAVVSVIPQSPFFGWVAQFGGDIVIKAPGDVVKSYFDFLEGNLAKQRGATGNL